jgi:chemotaxis receptor (MCP) glutamine deamidase CheD
MPTIATRVKEPARHAEDRFSGLPSQRLTIGEVKASAQPMQLKTLLGSCVAVCLYDPAGRMGGMNHISLPGDAPEKDARFGVHAMELLINQLMGLGCDRRRLVAKIFGGGNILSCIKTPIGDRNAEFVRTFLADEQIPLAAERVGGSAAMEVFFRTDNGYVLLRTLTQISYKEMEKQQALLQRPMPRMQQEEAVLF